MVQFVHDVYQKLNFLGQAISNIGEEHLSTLFASESAQRSQNAELWIMKDLLDEKHNCLTSLSLNFLINQHTVSAHHKYFITGLLLCYRWLQMTLHYSSSHVKLVQ